MDLSLISAAFQKESTPLIRTDFSNDDAWRAMIAEVTKPTDEFGGDEDDEFGGDEGGDGYSPNVVVIDDPSFDGVTGAKLAEFFTPSDESFGYVVLADARSMAEAAVGGELTVDYVDLSVYPFEDEHPDDDERELGRAFRCVVSEIAAIEANLSISNLDFDDFANNTSADGVYRGESIESPGLVVPEAEAGLAASVRIGRDVDRAEGARELSGTTGSVESVRTLRGTRRKLFLDFARVTSWSNIVISDSSWTWSGYPTEEPGSKQWAQSYDHADQLTGTHGAIQYSFVEVDKPRRAVRRWNWLAHPSPGVPYIDFDQWLPILAEDSIITVTLEESKDAKGDAWTEVRMRHDGLPVEWMDDMQAWWDLQLAIADHAGFGVPKK